MGFGFRANITETSRTTLFGLRQAQCPCQCPWLPVRQCCRRYCQSGHAQAFVLAGAETHGRRVQDVGFMVLGSGFGAKGLSWQASGRGRGA